MAYTVAQAEVLVLPNAENFGKTLEAQIGAQADEIGRKAGDRIGKEMRERIKVALAELPDAELGLDIGKAEAELARFNERAKVTARAGGTKAGQSMGDGMAEGISGRGALIGSAIAGALMVGGPLIVGAMGVVMAGIAGVIVHNVPAVETAAARAGEAFKAPFMEAAQSTVPAFVQALDTVGAHAEGMAHLAAPAFMAMQQPIQILTRGVLDLAQNTMPGLTHSLQTSEPVFQGLSSLLGSIGSGLSHMLEILSQHSEAGGVALGALGHALDSVLTSLGTLMGAGAELGSQVLPVLASALGALATVLQAISPILPGIVLGFAAFKVVGAITPMLGTLATKLETTGVNAALAAGEFVAMEGAGISAGIGMEAAAAGARGLQAAMGPIGWAMAAISLVVPALISHFGNQTASQDATKASAEALTQALQQSKGAIDENVRATAAMQAQKDGLFTWASTWQVSSSTVVDAILGNKDAMAQVQAAAEAYSGVQSKNIDLNNASAGGNVALNATYAGLAKGSDAALASIQGLAGTTATEVGNQAQLKAAMDGAADAAQANATRLQGLSNTASAANTQINLLKGALDALTGKAVSMGDAEVAVTTAVINASTALKGKTGALTDASGALDKHTEKGAAAWQAMTQLASADNTLISTMEQQGATAGEVAAKDAELRAQFIQSARQMGLSAAAANALADEIYGIPDKRNTEITADTKQATDAAAAVQRAIDNLHGKTLTVLVQTSNVGGGTSQGSYQTADGGKRLGAAYNAMGGVVHAYADGGLEPMAGGVATVVSPNTWRVIGDRVTDDEAYIPINDSARSQAILATTATRMGYGLTDGAGGAGRTDARTYQFHISAPSDPRAIAAEIREAQADLEFLHG